MGRCQAYSIEYQFSKNLISTWSIANFIIVNEYYQSLIFKRQTHFIHFKNYSFSFFQVKMMSHGIKEEKKSSSAHHSITQDFYYKISTVFQIQKCFMYTYFNTQNIKVNSTVRSRLKTFTTSPKTFSEKMIFV